MSSTTEKPYITWSTSDIIERHAEYDDHEVECRECGWHGKKSEVLFGLTEVNDLPDRIEPGQEVPFGECPRCDALCYIAPPLDKDSAFRKACKDQSLLSEEWEYTIEALTEKMKEFHPVLWWKATVDNFGWTGANGVTKPFFADTGDKLLRKVLPDTECSFKIYFRKDCIAINNAHHDSPCWNEWYYIKPMSCCNECGNYFPKEELVMPSYGINELDKVCSTCKQEDDDDLSGFY